MKICAISDLHGNLNFEIEPCDVLVICGDIFPLDIQTEYEECATWLGAMFCHEMRKMPAKHIIVIGGNHDFAFQYFNNDYINFIFSKHLTNATYIQDEELIIDGVKFYGTPWCHQFQHWAFMDKDSELKKKFKTIPDDVDVLITHDAPYGVSDVCPGSPWTAGMHLGNKPLLQAIKRTQPKYNIHGHLHSSNHNEELIKDTKVYNASLLNESYDLEYYPLYIEL